MTPKDCDHALLAEKDAQLTMALDALRSKDEQHASIVAAKDEQLTMIKEALAVALHEKEVALQNELMVRQMNNSLTAVQAIQLKMLSNIYISEHPPPEAVEVRLKKSGGNRWWMSERFETGSSGYNKSKWKLVVYHYSDSLMLLYSLSSKKIRASARIELLGKKAEIDEELFSGVKGCGDHKTIPLPMSRTGLIQLTHGLDSIMAYVEIDIHIME